MVHVPLCAGLSVRQADAHMSRLYASALMGAMIKLTRLTCVASVVATAPLPGPPLPPPSPFARPRARARSALGALDRRGGGAARSYDLLLIKGHRQQPSRAERQSQITPDALIRLQISILNAQSQEGMGYA